VCTQVPSHCCVDIEKQVFIHNELCQGRRWKLMVVEERRRRRRRGEVGCLLQELGAKA
jgi:hypothetical protein